MRRVQRSFPVALAVVSVVSLLINPASAANFWVQTNPSASQAGAVSNPHVDVAAGQSVTLYIWGNPAGLTLGYDGVSFDVVVNSSDGGAVTTTLNIDNPGGRWMVVNNGAALPGTGGIGVNDSNAYDLTNTNTIGSAHFRYASVTFTGLTPGTVQVFLAVGGKGIADAGNPITALVLGWFEGFTFNDFGTVNTSSFGAVSTYPEVFINVTALLGDSDGDGDVDRNDFAAFQACYSGPDTTPPGGCAWADFDGDNDVDLRDLAVFQNSFTD